MITEEKKKDPIGAIVLWLSGVFLLFFWIAYPILNMTPRYENLFVVKGSVIKVEESCSRYKFRESCFNSISLLHQYGTIKLRLSKTSPEFRLGDNLLIKTTRKPDLFSEFHTPYEIIKDSKEVVRFQHGNRINLVITSFLKILFCLSLIWAYFNQDRIVNIVIRRK